LWDDEFGLQRDDFIVSGLHQRRRQHAMVIFRTALASDSHRAMLTMDLPRAVVFGAVKRDQHVSGGAAEHVATAADPPELLDGFGKCRMQQCRGGWIEHVADVIVAADFGDAAQAGAVGAAMTLLEVALMGQERRALHEEHREGRHSDVTRAITRVHPRTPVRKPVQAASQ
jgi:hypothetical protein